MGLFSFLFGDSSSIDSSDTDINSDDSMEINPANGNPMIGGMGGIDIEGNPYGTDMNDDTFSSTDSFDDSFSSFDDPF